MKRKVALIGPSTLMVSLPSKFVKKFGIKKGDELDVEEKGSSLTINIDKITQGKSKNLDVHELNKEVNEYLRSFYSLYNKIDTNSFETFGKDYKKISKKIDENLVKAEKKDIQILAYLKMINEAIFNMNGALLVMHLEHI